MVLAIVVAALLGVTGPASAASNVSGTPVDQPAAAPANDNFANAQLLSGGSGSVTGTNVEATAEPGEPDHHTLTATSTVWYRWTAPSTGSEHLTTEGSGFDTVLAVYTGSSVGALTPVASSDNGISDSLSFAATAGVVYRIAVDGYSGAQGAIVLSWAAPPANDHFANGQVITGSTGSLDTSNVGATNEAGEPLHAGWTGGSSIWYRWTPPLAGPSKLNTIGTPFDTMLAVYTGSSVGALTEVASDDQSGGSNTSALTFQATPGVVYHIAVDGYLGVTGPVKFAWSQPEPPPAATITVTSPNGGETVAAGSTRSVNWTYQAAPAGGGQAESVASTSPSDADLDAVATEAEAEGTVRVIVGLNVGFRPEGTLPAPQVAAQRQAITAARERVVGRLRGTQHNVARTFETVPSVVLELSAAAVERLRGAGEVASITEDELATPTLAESTPLVEAPAAWAAGFDGSGQMVAVLDTGTQTNHPFLTGKATEEACYSGNSNCPNGSTSQTGPGAGVACTYSSSCSHGTHVAGIVAGANATSAGVARAARIMSVQVFSRFDGTDCGSGPSPCALSYSSDQIAGLERVYLLRATHSFASVNMSLGGGQYFANCDDRPQKAAIDNLRAVGIATVIASGNSGYTNSMGAPACISTAVSVGSTTKADTVSSFSNSASFLKLLAPGSDITSSVTGGGFESFNGTSMATPHVAGAWALLKQYRPTATVDQISNALAASGLAVTDSRNGIVKPRIRVHRALLALPAKVDIHLLKAGAVVSTIAEDVEASAGSFSWSVPAGLAAGSDYRVRVTSVVDPRATDTSDANFTVSAGAVATGPTYLSVGDVMVAEGNAGSAPATFTVTRSGDTTGSSTVSYTTPSSGSATAGSDYTAVAPTTLSFAAGETSKSVPVTVVGDTAVELNESFSLVLSAPTGATLSDGVGVGSIVNDDALPTLAVNDVSVTEGHAGSRTATFTITRSGVTTGTSTVSYTTPSNGAATTGTDYTAVPPTTVTFAAGETTKAVSVTVLGDTASEPSEAFYLVLSAPTGATIADSIGTALIVNDDALPTVAVGDVQVVEGNAGSTPVTFTITRSGATTGTSSVSYTTRAGSATADSDYTTIPSTRVIFNPGETTKTVTVNVAGDTAVEANETFSLVLSSPVGATLSDTTGPATIVNDDAHPSLAVRDVTVTEGNTGTTPATFTITRTGVTTGASSVSYTTPTNGTATAGADYTTVTATRVSFAPGETTKTVTVNVTGDTTTEANEQFYLALSAPTGATLADYLGAATIVNDDGASTPGPSTFLAVSDVTVVEPTTGSAPATFTITRTGNTTGPTSVSYATTPGTATAGSDFTAVAPTAVTFAAGETTKTVNVDVVGDTAVEANEAFSVTLSAPSGATLSDTTGTAVIVNDDAQPTLAVGDVTVAEGNSGPTPATFTVTRTGVTTGTSTVSYTTTPGTATAGSDYTAASGSLTFNPGEATKTVAVNVTGDTTVEANEYLYLTLSAPVGATFADNIAPAYILNDDPLPAIAVTDVTVAEGNSGPTSATFTLTRTGVTTGSSTVSSTTTPGTATAGTDYTAIAPTTVTFAAGETTKTVTVNIVGDTAVEATEAFTLTLSAPTGATLADTVGTATIVNDDATYLSISDVAVTEGNIGTAPATFTITRTGGTTGTSSISYTTTGGTAAAGTDYTAVAPTPLTFAPGETTKTVTVNVAGDTAVEPNETFTLVLSAPTGATLSDNVATATITNDD